MHGREIVQIQEHGGVRHDEQGDIRLLGHFLKGLFVIGLGRGGREEILEESGGGDIAGAAAVVEVQAHAVVKDELVPFELLVGRIHGERLGCTEQALELKQAGDLLDRFVSLFFRDADEGGNGRRHAGHGRRKQGFLLYVHAGGSVVSCHNEAY